MIKYPDPETCKSLSCISYLLQELFDPKSETDFGSTRNTISKNSSLEEEARQKKKKYKNGGSQHAKTKFTFHDILQEI